MEVLLTRKDIVKVLEKWLRGEKDHREVYEWANSLYLSDEVIVNDWEDDNSVTNEVLSHLDTLDMNLVVKDDIPSLLKFLETPFGKFEIGYQRWKEYLCSIDYNTRKLRLVKDSFYMPFCGDTNFT